MEHLIFPLFVILGFTFMLLGALLVVVVLRLINLVETRLPLLLRKGSSLSFVRRFIASHPGIVAFLRPHLSVAA